MTRAPVTIDAASGKVVEVRRRRARHDPVRARDFDAELEDEVRRFFEAQRARAIGMAENLSRELGRTLRRALKGRG